MSDGGWAYGKAGPWKGVSQIWGKGKKGGKSGFPGKTGKGPAEFAQSSAWVVNPDPWSQWQDFSFGYKGKGKGALKGEGKGALKGEGKGALKGSSAKGSAAKGGNLKGDLKVTPKSSGKAALKGEGEGALKGSSAKGSAVKGGNLKGDLKVTPKSSGKGALKGEGKGGEDKGVLKGEGKGALSTTASEGDVVPQPPKPPTPPQPPGSLPPQPPLPATGLLKPRMRLHGVVRPPSILLHPIGPDGPPEVHVQIDTSSIRLAGLPTYYSKRDVEGLCSQHGAATDIDMNNNGQCIVTFQDASAAQKAAAAINGKKLPGGSTFLKCELIDPAVVLVMKNLQEEKELATMPENVNIYVDELQLATDKAGERADDCEVFLRDLPEMVEEELREWLSGFGTVKEATFLRSATTDKLTGSAYARFSKHEEAVQVMNNFPVSESGSSGDIQASWSLSERLGKGEDGSLQGNVVGKLIGQVEKPLREETKCPSLTLIGESCISKGPKFSQESHEGPLHFVCLRKEASSSLDALRSRLTRALVDVQAPPKAEVEVADVKVAERTRKRRRFSTTDPEEIPARLLVRGFPASWKEQQLRLVFALFGGTESVSLDWRDGSREAVVQLKDPSQTATVAARLHDTEVGDGEIIETCKVFCEVVGAKGKNSTASEPAVSSVLPKPKNDVPPPVSTPTSVPEAPVKSSSEQLAVKHGLPLPPPAVPRERPPDSAAPSKSSAVPRERHPDPGAVPRPKASAGQQYPGYPPQWGAPPGFYGQPYGPYGYLPPPPHGFPNQNGHDPLATTSSSSRAVAGFLDPNDHIGKAIAKGKGLIKKGQACVAAGNLEEANSYYHRGLQRILKLDQADARVASMQKKLSRYVDEAEALQQRLDQQSQPHGHVEDEARRGYARGHADGHTRSQSGGRRRHRRVDIAELRRRAEAGGRHVQPEAQRRVRGNRGHADRSRSRDQRLPDEAALSPRGESEDGLRPRINLVARSDAGQDSDQSEI